jgi:hypothetical protein
MSRSYKFKVSRRRPVSVCCAAKIDYNYYE